MLAMARRRQGIGRIDSIELVSAEYLARLSVAPFESSRRGGRTNEKAPSNALAIGQTIRLQDNNRGRCCTPSGWQCLRSSAGKLTVGERRQRFADGVHWPHRKRARPGRHRCWWPDVRLRRRRRKENLRRHCLRFRDGRPSRELSHLAVRGLALPREPQCRLTPSFG